MNQEQTDAFKRRYRSFTLDQLGHLIDRVRKGGIDLTEEALAALEQVIAERGVNVEQVFIDHNALKETDRKHLAEKERKKDASFRRRDKFLSRLFGFLGLLLSPISFYLSTNPLHIGGLFASVAWLASSVWCIRLYKDS